MARQHALNITENGNAASRNDRLAEGRTSVIDVFSINGTRKYVNSRETDLIIERLRHESPQLRLFCHVLIYTGCRISEALSITMRSIDFNERQLVIECMKKRRKGVYRCVPIPDDFVRELRAWGKERGFGERLWSWSRMTAYRHLIAVMHAAGVVGDHATPKGLRHGFAVRAIQNGAPLDLVQRWLGHADIRTTAIYSYVLGPEERRIAARMWQKPRTRPAAAPGPSRPSASGGFIHLRNNDRAGSGSYYI